jgi:hypothetical protein
MKIKFIFTFLLFTTVLFGQNSENLVPKDAASVFSINNISLFQKISLDELVKYEFMEEVQQELFDGSTSGKTLKESGFDFDQKFNVFYGNGDDYEVSGFTFGIADKEMLFEVFDDFQPMESEYPGVEFYISYFNRIAIKGNAGVLYRVTPNDRFVNDITDSVWYANGNEYPWYDDFYDEINWDEFEEEQTEDVEFFDEMEIEENTSNPIETEDQELPAASADPTEKTYYEFRDSIELMLQLQFLKKVNDELFIEGKSLISEDKRFAARLSNTAEGTFYIDNSRTIRKDYDIRYMRLHYPTLYNDLYEVYKDNLITGELTITDHSIEMHMDANYGEKLGSIYEKLTDTKFDKKFFNYVHKDNSGFFNYRVNLRAAYEQAYDVIVPILEREAENTKDMAYSLLLIEIMDEFLNKDAIFDTYKGGMFASYSGIKKVKTKKVIFDYDDETFEYTEQTVEAEEDMPIFTTGFSTDRSDIASKLLARICKIAPNWTKHENYIEIENGMLNAAPLYLIVNDGIFIITNNEDLAINNPKGFGANSLAKATQKKALKSGVAYSYIDLGKAIESIPKSLFSDRENELIDITRGKTGSLEFTSSGTSRNKTSFNLTYNFEGEYDSSGTYILDLINSMYVIAK